MKKSSGNLNNKQKKPPIRTEEGRESYLINLAMDFVEKRLIDGTATSQEAIHFLRLGSQRAALEMEKIRCDMSVAEAKIKQIESQDNLQALYEDAKAAMKSYTGGDSQDFKEVGHFYED